MVVLSNERGPPDQNQHSPAETQAAIINDVRYSTVTQDWNEYIVDDGARVRIQPMIMRVAKTSLYDSRGIPVYWVDMEASINVVPPQT
jgi:hypothetical protein